MSKRPSYTPSLAETFFRKSIESSPMAMATGVRMSQLPKVVAPEIADLKPAPIEIEKPNEDEVLAQLGVLMWRMAERTPRALGEKLQETDDVLLDALAYCDGQLVPFMTKGDFSARLGDEDLYPGIDAHLLSARVGEVVNVPVQLPAEFPVASMASRAAVYAVRVTKAFAVSLPDPESAAFLKKVGKEDTLEALMARMYDEVAEIALSLATLQSVETWLSAVAARVPEPMPEALVQEELALKWMEEEGKTLMRLNVPPAEREAVLKAWLEDSDLRVEATQRLATTCAVLAIAERDQIRLEKQQLTALLETYNAGPEWNAETLVARAQKGDESAKQMLSALVYVNVVETLLDRAQQ